MQQNKNHKKVRELLRLYQDGAVFTAFDTETTGLSAHNDRLLEIGAVQFSKDGILATYSQLINPCRAIPYEASQINNITHDMVQDCPTEQDILPDFQIVVITAYDFNCPMMVHKSFSLFRVHTVTKYAPGVL